MDKKKHILIGAALFNWSETQRMIYIAEQLIKRGCHITFMGDGKYAYLVEQLGVERTFLECDEKWFTDERVYKMLNLDKYGNGYATAEEIKEVVEEEVKVINECKPDLILTGYRNTLTVSSKVTKIPLVWCLSAVVSPMFFQKGLATIPVDIKVNHFLTNITDEKQKEKYYAKFACMNALSNNNTSKEWNKVLKGYGLPEFKSDMAIFQGDYNLMSDAKELFKEFEADNKQYGFCGPFQPRDEEMDLPQWLKEYKHGDRKVILVTMGSSGSEEILTKTLESLVSLDYDIFVSTLGKINNPEEKYPDNFYFAEKFPIQTILNKVDGCIIHGGQGTLYSVAFAGKPFVGVPMFNEQQYNLKNLTKKYPAGLTVLKNEISKEKMQQVVREIMEQEHYAESARQLKQQLSQYVEQEGKSAPVVAADKIMNMVGE